MKKDDHLSNAAKKLGSRGGKKQTAKQRAAALKNLKKANKKKATRK